MNTTRWYLAAWRLAPYFPLRLVRWATHRVADVMVAARVPAVAQLQRNMERLVGGPVSSTQVRAAVRSHVQNYGEQFAMARVIRHRPDTLLVLSRKEELRQLVESGPVVIALTHAGNWDIAGAALSGWGMPVVTVAERLESQALFQAFVDFREDLGMHIIGAGPGEHVFSTLVQQVEGQHVVVPLLADRDITGTGIEVQLGSAQALVGAGPAALAKKLNAPLMAAMLYYGPPPHFQVVADLVGPIAAPGAGNGRSDVENHTQAWVDALLPSWQKHVTDWHMMQRVFVEDLDLQRLARSRAKHDVMKDAS